MVIFRPSSQAIKLTSLLVLLPALLLAGCSAENIRDEDGTVVSAGSWSVFDLRPGDCISEFSSEDMVPLAPCDEPHGQEVYSVITSTEMSYPGSEALAARADQQCLADLGDLVTQVPEGIPFSYLLPTETTWQKNNDRAIVCVLIFPGGQAVGSFFTGTADHGTIG
jgi:hypothetical protein